MRILYPTRSGRQFYEANSITRVITCAVLSAAPHALTQRASYTVPVGRRAFITATNLILWRDSAAAPVGEYLISVRLTINGVQASLRRVASRSNTLYIYDIQGLAEQVLMNSTDQVELMTFDGSTGGTCSFIGSVTYVEYDT